MTLNSNRAYNFNSGPSALPLTVLQKAQAEFIDFQGTGMSIMEISHRAKEYDTMHNQAIGLLKELLTIPADYDVLFLQGGASLQFSMVPMNFLPQGKKAGYVLTGSWGEQAMEEAKIQGEVFEAASTTDGNYSRIPDFDELKYSSDTAYLHLTSNNTIHGTQWHSFPDTGNIPLIADMSSDILSRAFDVSKFSLIYAGAQKNLGPSGVTVVIIKRALLEGANSKVPTMLQYAIHAKHNSLYNTPPTFAIYMMGKVLGWIKEQGGLAVIEKQNREKSALIYDTIDASNGFYKGHARRDSRSYMNLTFCLSSVELENMFLAKAKKEGFVGLNGYRPLGRCRASAYNAVRYESCLALRNFMLDFQQKNG